MRKAYPTLPFPGAAANSTAPASGDWSHYGRSAAGTRYAPFAEINASNVSNLEIAWTYRTGVGGAFKATPLQIGDTLYVCLAGNIITALDADSGKRRWQFDPQLRDSKVGFTTTCRGVTYYKAPEALEECAERILTATTDARLIAVDAKTGARCSRFGDNGEVSLLTGMGDVKPGFYYVTSPPTMARGVAVLGGWVADNVEVAEPSGVIRGFDAISGELRWAWDLGRTDVLTALPTGGTYTRGTPNAWSVFSADEELGLVYIPTGNATPDYYGGHRSPESERFASSVVALDAGTGALRWSFQTTHHDIWDYDVPSQPVLIDIPVGDGDIAPALVAPTKRGELFLLDRRTGEPLAAVEERPAPQTDVAAGVDGEDAAVLRRHALVWTRPGHRGEDVGRDADRSDALPHRVSQAPLRRSAHAAFAQGQHSASGLRRRNELGKRRDRRSKQRHDRERTADRESRAALPACAGDGGDAPRLRRRVAASARPMRRALIPFCRLCSRHVSNPHMARSRRSISDRRQILWRRPLGTANELGPLGLKSRLPIPMGVPYSGGAVVTKGGLIFMGGAMDRRMRAFDIENGEVLWRDVLPNNAQATPMSYVSPATRRQYVVITVPAIDMPESSHAAEPEAKRGAETNPSSEQAVRMAEVGDRVFAAALRSAACQAEDWRLEVEGADCPRRRR